MVSLKGSYPDIFINNLDSGMDCKDPDDTNLTSAADLLEGRGDIQKNHYKLEKCACVNISEVQPGQLHVPAPESEQSLVSNQVEDQ